MSPCEAAPRLTILPCLPIYPSDSNAHFFFQAEDGIRDVAVTGVQTCALPISEPNAPRRVARRRALRQSRASALPSGVPGTRRNRKLRTNTAKAKNRTPAVNFESNAPARLKAKRKTFPRVGSRHRLENVHSASSENSVNATSVCTRGPKARNAGVLTYRLRQSSPPHAPPSRLARTYTAHPSASISNSIGNRAHLSKVFGSFHLSSSHSPNTH